MSKLAALLLVSCVGLAGCAPGIRVPDGERMRLRSDEFAAYAEAVFRKQNEALDALAFALDEQPDDLRLLRAEDDVLEACLGLNEIAVRRRDARSTRPLRELRAARRVPDCARAAEAAFAELGAAEE
jgi:hypothetical protein